jgi:hypothetical protein
MEQSLQGKEMSAKEHSTSNLSQKPRGCLGLMWTLRLWLLFGGFVEIEQSMKHCIT